jgi:hypothetical protein
MTDITNHEREAVRALNDFKIKLETREEEFNVNQEMLAYTFKNKQERDDEMIKKKKNASSFLTEDPIQIMEAIINMWDITMKFRNIQAMEMVDFHALQAKRVEEFNANQVKMIVDIKCKMMMEKAEFDARKAKIRLTMNKDEMKARSLKRVIDLSDIFLALDD